jgi:hypothetical protein
MLNAFAAIAERNCRELMISPSQSRFISLNIYTHLEPLRKNPRFKAILAKMGLE